MFLIEDTHTDRSGINQESGNQEKSQYLINRAIAKKREICTVGKKIFELYCKFLTTLNTTPIKIQINKQSYKYSIHQNQIKYVTVELNKTQ